MSNNFNPTERAVAQLLSRFPRAKAWMKKAYQWLNFRFGAKRPKWESPYILRSFEFEQKETFFGYYDKSPESPDGRYVLYHAVNPPSFQLPLPEEIAHIIVFDQWEDQVVMDVSTTSFNWQQGARAMWVAADRFLFNDYNASDDRYVSRLFSVKEKRLIRTYDRPVYDLCGKLALSLSFERLQQLRPEYGYRDREGKVSGLEDEKKDGIFLMDLQNGASQLLLSLARIKDIMPLPTMDGAKHWVNHLMMSPGGHQLIFLHRWKKSGKVFHRLMHSSIEEAIPRVLADGIISHACWDGDQHIICYCTFEGMPGSYYRFDLRDGSRRVPADIIPEPYGDGHPSVLGDWMLTDSYPDRRRVKHLLMRHLHSGEERILGRFFDPMKFFGPSRCDLHPRWSPDGKRVYFDSVHEGRRRLYSICLDES